MSPVNIYESEKSDLSALLRQLAVYDPKSNRQDFITSLLSYSSDMEGQELQIFSEMLNQKLDSGQMDHIYLYALQQICISHTLLPQSYYLSGVAEVRELPAVRGDSADIWEGRSSGSLVAIKIVRADARDLTAATKRFYNEAVIWKYLSHPNIVPFLGVARLPDLPPLCMVSPWMENGTVPKYLQSNPDTNRVALLLNICEGIQYLHSLDVVHGDLKGDNILVDNTGRACITDFGLAFIRKDLESTVNDPAMTPRPIGVWRWMAPELLFPDMVVASSRGPSKASDMYALAMVGIEVFSGRVPFQELPEMTTVPRVVEGMRPRRPEHAELSDALWELVERCWHQDRANRPTIYFVSDNLRAMAKGASIIERLIKVVRNFAGFI